MNCKNCGLYKIAKAMNVLTFTTENILNKIRLSFERGLIDEAKSTLNFIDKIAIAFEKKNAPQKAMEAGEQQPTAQSTPVA